MNDLVIDENGARYTIRYDGLDAVNHQIDLAQLGVSLQGFARVLSVIAHFSYTGNYNKQYDALSVKIFAVPTEEHHCFEVKAWIAKVISSENLWSGTGGGLLVALLNFLFRRRDAEEMKYLSEALKQSISQNDEANKRLIGVVERLVDGLNPAVKQALSPIGETCSSISVYQGSKLAASFDQDTKDRFYETGLNTIEPTRKYSGVISELDMETGTCKVALEGSDPKKRTNGLITDPTVRLPNNIYAITMTKGESLTFVAKAEIDPDGNLVKLHVSDSI